MQVPEKLSLIGGSILLASTLVFTLKSQASSILPKVNNGMTILMKSDQERQQDQQKQQGQVFDSNFQQAQHNNWQTGQWGTANYYIDNQGNMHIGSGQLYGQFSNVVNTNSIRTINFEGEVQAPQDSSELLSTGESLTNINGLTNLDTSHVTNMHDMFFEDSKITNLDLSHFNTSYVTDTSFMFAYDDSIDSLDLSQLNTHNVNDMNGMFNEADSLKNLNLANWDTSHVTNMANMFSFIPHLTNLNLSNFDTTKAEMADMFNGDNIYQFSLGSNTKLSNESTWNGTYQHNGQTLSISQLADNNSHPGTWIRQ